MDLWRHANARYYHCDVIFVDCSQTRKSDFHQWITTVNIDFSSPGIHGLVCKNQLLPKSEFVLIRGTPYLVLTGELCRVYCEDFRENLPHFNGAVLLHICSGLSYQLSLFMLSDKHRAACRKIIKTINILNVIQTNSAYEGLISEWFILGIPLVLIMVNSYSIKQSVFAKIIERDTLSLPHEGEVWGPWGVCCQVNSLVPGRFQ